MKEYNLLKNKANPTTETQEKILFVIQNSKMPMSLTAIAEQSKTGINQVKRTIDSLEKFAIVKRIVSSGGTTFIMFIKKEVAKRENGITT